MERNKLDFIKQKLESHVQYTDRINKELDILVDLDCFDKFYDMYENIINNKSKIGNKNEINSICAFLLGMTTKEPDKEFNIPKRRTYARDGFPDIDMDFDHLRRHEIVDYLINKYGRDYISNIGTVQILQPKSALRRAIKVLDPGNFVKYDNGVKVKSDNNESFQLENEILNTLPKHMKLDDGTLIKSLKFAYDNLPSFKRYMDIYPEVYNLAVRLEGTVASMGVHAAGVLLSPEPMKQIAPLHITKGEDISADDDTDKGKILTATQFSMKDVESLGLIKFDVLGLSTKSSISLTKKLLKRDTVLILICHLYH